MTSKQPAEPAVSQEPQTTVELPYDHAAERLHRKRGLFFIGLAVGAAGFAMAIQLGANSNFVVEEIGVSGLQQGLLETFRESCGIIALGVLAMLVGLAEPIIGAGMLLLVAVGLSSYAAVPDYLWLVAASLVWSQGLHVWMPLPNSMTLALAEPGKAGRRLGQVHAAGAAGMAVGLLAAYLLHVSLKVQIRPLYVMAGGAALLGACACLAIPRKIKTPRPRFVFRRKYALYYLLCFLEGWRKQIFVAFAGYLLVRYYDVKLETMLLLWLAIQSISYLAAPPVGRIIDRIGERRVLMFYFACLTVFFVGYAFIKNRYVLYGLYVIDSAYFVLAMALTTYVNKIAPKSEHTATLSMGVAMNHIAAVTMPLVGGLLWKYCGYQWTFLIGAAAAAASIPVAALLPSNTASRRMQSDPCQARARTDQGRAHPMADFPSCPNRSEQRQDLGR